MGPHFFYASCRYFILCAWIGNFITAQMTSQDSNSGFSQGHHSGSAYFFYQQPVFPNDCKEVRQRCSFQNKSGVYLIKPDGFTEPFEVFCDNSEISVDGGWTVILRHLDGSIGNKRTWNEYKHGFGFLGSEFWLGNNKIAYLTNQRQYELRIDMVISDGSSFHITYDKFRLTDEWSGYSLASVGEYSGSANLFITVCDRNMKFGVCTCQGTCNQPEVKNVCNNNCHHGEGCFCPDGFLFRGSDCVPENECGCFDQGKGVIPNGDDYVNTDCTSRCTCNNHVLTCENYRCSPNANCEERQDVRKCYCVDGFEGDGQRCTSTIIGEDCLDLYNVGERNNGEYAINPSGWSDGSFQVYCDMTTVGGGWTVFQRQKNGNIDFYRDWSGYKTGFGNQTEEFWLGNDKLHAITNQKSYQIRVDVTNSEGSSYYALYDLFRIGDESNNYRMVELGGFSGTAAYDSMDSRRNRPFSTHDNDNEASSYNCAEKHRGGWWYGYDYGHNGNNAKPCSKWSGSGGTYYCSASNLNGDYRGGNGENIFWWIDYYYRADNVDCNIRFTEMKIRPV